jgi:hypothetical protein
VVQPFFRPWREVWSSFWMSLQRLTVAAEAVVWCFIWAWVFYTPLPKINQHLVQIIETSH